MIALGYPMYIMAERVLKLDLHNPSPVLAPRSVAAISYIWHGSIGGEWVTLRIGSLHSIYFEIYSFQNVQSYNLEQGLQDPDTGDNMRQRPGEPVCLSSSFCSLKATQRWSMGQQDTKGILLPLRRSWVPLAQLDRGCILSRARSPTITTWRTEARY